MSKPDKPQFTRRDVKKLAPEILGHYHDMLMSYDVESFDKLLGIYRVDEAIRDSLRAEFNAVCRDDFASALARSKIIFAS